MASNIGISPWAYFRETKYCFVDYLLGVQLPDVLKLFVVEAIYLISTPATPPTGVYDAGIFDLFSITQFHCYKLSYKRKSNFLHIVEPKWTNSTISASVNTVAYNLQCSSVACYYLIKRSYCLCQYIFNRETIITINYPCCLRQ